MSIRFLITFLWLASLVTAYIVTQSYEQAFDDSGKRLIFREDFEECIKPLVGIYAGHLAAILGFWFTRPLKPARSDAAARTRSLIALACTVIFNGIVLFYASYTHLFGSEGNSVYDNVMTAVFVTGLLSFIVAPVNVYYFGAKLSAGAGPEG